MFDCPGESRANRTRELETNVLHPLFCSPGAIRACSSLRSPVRSGFTGHGSYSQVDDYTDQANRLPRVCQSGHGGISCKSNVNKILIPNRTALGCIFVASLEGKGRSP